jgi:hypothetical protein
MTDVILGLLAILIGLLFCFAGAGLMRFALALWGALVGFAFGAGLVAGIGGDGLLSTALSWTVGLIAALLFAVLAYLFYAVAVVLAMGGAGFAIGSGIIVAIGIDWSWVAVIVGVVVGVLFAVLAIVADLPLAVLIVASAVGGAAVAVVGLMLVFNSIDAEAIETGGFIDLVREDWWWWLPYAALAVLGLLAQGLTSAARKTSVRRQWEQEPA